MATLPPDQLPVQEIVQIRLRLAADARGLLSTRRRLPLHLRLFGGAGPAEPQGAASDASTESAEQEERG